ncbi:hypothetical protein DPEC_G00180570 [Dallia pectoralis]|uniref:Uncharacterized protein n=1 Tax=Dallia pectoralis TaxID=75939 RepID=A0ACC2GAA7_DALPE|nr:hypothetical protein DPEC_G00180570 [Dallia pectoralis]
MKHLMTLLLLAGLVRTTSGQNTTAVYNTIPGALDLKFSLNQPFTLDLSDQTSPGFKTLAATVTSAVTAIYVSVPGFSYCIVNSFRSGSVVTDMTLVFENKTVVPSTSAAQATFNKGTTNLTIVPGSVTVDLSNPSSTAFKNLAALVVSQVTKVYQSFPGFLLCFVNSFRSGSVVTRLTLQFANGASVPSNASVIAALSASSTSLNIIPNSISVTSPTSSGTSPRPGPFCLMALPVTLALLMVPLLAS